MEMVGFALFFAFGALAGYFYAQKKFKIKEDGPHGKPGGGGGGSQPQ